MRTFSLLVFKSRKCCEFIVLEPAKSLEFEEKDGLKVEPLRKAMACAKKNGLYAYAYDYMLEKYGD
ncbi:hypothetical protein HZC09_04750 [Candidatus Micrarchaeota archaeon]|nr:hypothetical protein [Candidatus Micrarchaeota archaeon]